MIEEILNYDDLFEACSFVEDSGDTADYPMQYSTNIPASHMLSLLPKALPSIYKEYCNIGYKRTMNILPKIARSSKIEHGHMLVTFFVHVYIERGTQVHTDIADDLLPEFNESAKNCDYKIEKIIETYKKLTTRLSRNFHNTLEKKGHITFENEKCVVSVENKKREDNSYIVCTSCEGEGWHKCKKCKGSGRETYADGSFASGIERTKTGQCSNCYGSGKIKCKQCNGTGKNEIFASEYSIVKSVDESIYIVPMHIYSTAWNDWAEKSCCRDISKTERELDAAISNKEESAIRIWKQNRKMAKFDFTEQISAQMQKMELSDLYAKNLELEREAYSEYDKYDLVLSLEHHCVIPVSRLYVKIGEDDYSFRIYPNGKNSIKILFPDSYLIHETSVWKWLYYKLLK